MSRSMMPLPRCVAPAACPAAHSLSSRTSIRRCPPRGSFWYSWMLICLTRDFASLTRARNPSLCFLCGVLTPTSLTRPADTGSGARQFHFDLLIAPIDVIDAIDDGFTVRGEAREHQRSACPEVARDHLGTGESGRPLDDRLPPFDADIGAHARQFLRMHEAILEDRFRDEGDAFGLGHERHELRLKVGREAGMLFRLHVDALEFSTCADSQPVGTLIFNLGSRLP